MVDKYMWLVAAILDSANREHFKRHRELLDSVILTHSFSSSPQLILTSTTSFACRRCTGERNYKCGGQSLSLAHRSETLNSPCLTPPVVLLMPALFFRESRPPEGWPLVPSVHFTHQARPGLWGGKWDGLHHPESECLLKCCILDALLASPFSPDPEDAKYKRIYFRRQGGHSSVVEHVPSTHEVLGAIPRPPLKRK